jgi:uncharacterized protein YxeA
MKKVMVYLIIIIVIILVCIFIYETFENCQE